MNQYEQALNAIKESYDAFYVLNKYGDNNTHQKEFDLLTSLGLDSLSQDRGALGWIKHRYDCYYSKEFEDERDSAFEFVRNIVKDL